MIGDGLRLAVGTFTAVPIRPPVRIDRDVARLAMIAAPVATIPLAAISAGVSAAGNLVHLPALLTASLSVGAIVLGNRGLHLDGLSDTADGLAASYDRDRALEIMRRGNTGPAGTVATVLLLVIQITALAEVLDRPWGAVAGALTFCLARCALLIACAAGVPAARPEGLGAAVAGVVPRSVAIVGGTLCAAAAGGLTMLIGRPFWQGVLAVTVAGAAVAGLISRCRRRFGGITGDVLGAAVEIAAAALLTVAAAG